MSTPIFDQLVAEFAARGKHYEDMKKSFLRKPQGIRGVTPTVSQLDETMSFAVVKPIAVVSLNKRGTAA
jgi:hypothetical protein